MPGRPPGGHLGGLGHSCVSRSHGCLCVASSLHEGPRRGQRQRPGLRLEVSGGSGLDAPGRPARWTCVLGCGAEQELGVRGPEAGKRLASRVRGSTHGNECGQPTGPSPPWASGLGILQAPPSVCSQEHSVLARPRGGALTPAGCVPPGGASGPFLGPGTATRRAWEALRAAAGAVHGPS